MPPCESSRWQRSRPRPRSTGPGAAAVAVVYACWKIPPSCALAGLCKPSMLDRQSLHGPVREPDEADVDRLVADLGDHELALEDLALAGVPHLRAVGQAGGARAERLMDGGGAVSPEGTR